MHNCSILPGLQSKTHCFQYLIENKKKAKRRQNKNCAIETSFPDIAYIGKQIFQFTTT